MRKGRNYKIIIILLYVILAVICVVKAISEKTVEGSAEIEEAPRIALTFDDGPNIYTETLIDGPGY